MDQIPGFVFDGQEWRCEKCVYTTGLANKAGAHAKLHAEPVAENTEQEPAQAPAKKNRKTAHE